MHLKQLLPVVTLAAFPSQAEECRGFSFSNYDRSAEHRVMHPIDCISNSIYDAKNSVSCVSEEEAVFMRSGVERIEMMSGTPEPDALRFYSSTSRNEYVEFNYAETKAGVLGKDYALEDPLVFADGRCVRTAHDWAARRRELLDLFEREVYGRLPPPPGEMSFDVMDEKTSEDRFATIRRYRQYFRNDKSRPVIDWIVVLPRHARERVPVFLHLNYAGLDKIESKKTNHYNLPWDVLVASGYAFMSACYTQITGDGEDRGGIFNGVCELWGERDFGKTDNSGSLMIWAWGLMRGLDLAERIPEIDASRNVVIGSSRLGKAALLAAAYDERVAVCIANQTGAVGVQLMKRDYGETLKGQRLAVPHWYCRSVWKYAEDPKTQPFDQHLLLSCIAPRALLLECYHKKWFDPKGEWMAAKAASSAWELLTGKALGGGEQAPDEWPEPYSDVMVRPPFGYVRRTECHGLGPYDWKWAVDFANGALDQIVRPSHFEKGIEGSRLGQGSLMQDPVGTKKRRGPRETLIFLAICGCSPIAMPGAGRRNEIMVRTKSWSACCSVVAAHLLRGCWRWSEGPSEGIRRIRRGLPEEEPSDAANERGE